jgi:hypothetical protein
MCLSSAFGKDIAKQSVPRTNGQGTSLLNPRLHFVGWEPSALQSNSFGFYGWKVAQDVARDLNLAELPAQFTSPRDMGTEHSLRWTLPALVVGCAGAILLRRRVLRIRREMRS